MKKIPLIPLFILSIVANLFMIIFIDPFRSKKYFLPYKNHKGTTFIPNDYTGKDFNTWSEYIYKSVNKKQ